MSAELGTLNVGQFVQALGTCTVTAGMFKRSLSMMARRPRSLLAAIAVSGCAAAGLAGCGSARTTVQLRPVAAVRSVSALSPAAERNRRAAVSDAGRLLSLAVLPPGSVRLAKEPDGDSGYLPPAAGPTPVGTLTVARYGWWRTSRGFSSAVAFMRAHPPQGSRSAGSGNVDGGTKPENEQLVYSFPASGPAISSRSLILSLVGLRGGGTGIEVTASDIWIMPRPASEKIPSVVRELDIHESHVMPSDKRRTPLTDRVVTGVRLRRIIAWLDALPIDQPGAYSCPGQAYSPRDVMIAFSFRKADRLPVLATARLLDNGHPSDQCNTIGLSIRNRTQTPLIGGNFLTRVERVLAVHFR